MEFLAATQPPTPVGLGGLLAQCRRPQRRSPRGFGLDRENVEENLTPQNWAETKKEPGPKRGRVLFLIRSERLIQRLC